ncbi:MAG: hypothetical protein ABIO43_02065 [Sphingomicrobium sp.]
MRIVRNLAAFAAPGLALLLAGAAPADRVIPLPEADDEALIIPADSPVKFRGFDKYGVAHFSGKFVLTGSFTYGCWSSCADYNGPVTEGYLDVRIEADPELAARLPHWKLRKGPMLVLINREQRFARTVATREQHRSLLSGKLGSVQGRAAIIVDDFRTGIECDSENHSARFISLAKLPKIAKVDFDGDYGCG